MLKSANSLSLFFSFFFNEAFSSNQNKFLPKELTNLALFSLSLSLSNCYAKHFSMSPIHKSPMVYLCSSLKSVKALPEF